MSTSLTPGDLDAVCKLVDELCGIYLDAKKDYLIEGRLSELVRRYACTGYVDLVKRARMPGSRELVDDIVDAITTNETLWFRDTSPFEALKHKVFPELVDSKSKTAFPRRLRVWSAASSTGQEAYSIAMAFADMVGTLTGWDLQIYGTDISPTAVRKAQEGVYSELEISRGLDQHHLSGYFVRHPGGWQVCPELRRICRFETRNLLKPLTGLGPFDVIFCRNVAIYFTSNDRSRLFYGLAETLQPEGWVFVGSSETLSDLGPEWKPQQHCRAVCYRPKQPVAASARDVSLAR
jgi:chemotaxis protein methyltransferase CheR